MNKAKTKAQPVIPRKIKVGRKQYSIDVVESMIERGHMAKVYYDDSKIKIGKCSNVTGKAFSDVAVQDSFWHEITHAILYDMGRHRLNADEKFVTEFANRLTAAINSARF
jgi:hypothetical protein